MIKYRTHDYSMAMRESRGVGVKLYSPKPVLTPSKPIHHQKKNSMCGGIFLPPPLPPTCRINYIFQYSRKVVFIFLGVSWVLNG